MVPQTFLDPFTVGSSILYCVVVGGESVIAMRTSLAPILRGWICLLGPLFPFHKGANAKALFAEFLETHPIASK
jgi:hypothetical protein